MDYTVIASAIRSDYNDTLYGIIVVTPRAQPIQGNFDVNTSTESSFSGGNYAWGPLFNTAGKKITTDYSGRSVRAIMQNVNSPPPLVDGKPIAVPVVNDFTIEPTADDVATVVVLNLGASYSALELSALNGVIISWINKFITLNSTNPVDLINFLNPLPWHGCDGPLAVGTLALTVPIVISQTNLGSTLPLITAAEVITPIGGGCHTSSYSASWEIARSSDPRQLIH